MWESRSWPWACLSPLYLPYFQTLLLLPAWSASFLLWLLLLWLVSHCWPLDFSELHKIAEQEASLFSGLCPLYTL